MPENGPIDISKGYEELVASLTRNKVRANSIDSLCESAGRLLDDGGEPAFVNGEPAVVTRQSTPIELEGVNYFARVADGPSLRHGTVDLPSIVFCETEDFPQTKSSNLNSMNFLVLANGAEIHLSVGDADEISDNDPRYVSLAEQIIHNIRSKYDAEAEEIAVARLAEKQNLERVAQEKIQRRRHRVAAAGKAFTSVVLGAGLMYNHLFYESDHLDAKVGKFPLPAPVEWIVDWAKHSEHVAEGFPNPRGATVAHPHQTITKLPVIPDYAQGDADHKLSKAYALDHNGSSGAHQGGISEPGLYKFTFSRVDNDPFDKTGCVGVLGNFNHDRTSVFTTDPNTSKSISISIVGPRLAQICLKPMVPRNFSGIVGFYETVIHDPSIKLGS